MQTNVTSTISVHFITETEMVLQTLVYSPFIQPTPRKFQLITRFFKYLHNASRDSFSFDLTQTLFPQAAQESHKASFFLLQTFKNRVPTLQKVHFMFIANANLFVRSAPFWAITQFREVTPYRPFRTIHRFHLIGQKVQSIRVNRKVL